jgi:hypothetical protein
LDTKKEAKPRIYLVRQEDGKSKKIAVSEATTHDLECSLQGHSSPYNPSLAWFSPYLVEF